ncbi:MAG: sodium-dependent bicarbonate transport family permease, partial [Bacteroidota bacterium]
GLSTAFIIPLITFFLLRQKLGMYNAGAVAAAYGSVSAVTFVTAVNYLELQGLPMHGHLVAVMAMMEAPAIIMGLLLISIFNTDRSKKISKRHAIRHSFTNGSVFLIVGSLLIGFLTNDLQADGIKPFTNDLFKGFLVIFLLDMGITSGKNLKGFLKGGLTPLVFAILMPLVMGSILAVLTGWVTGDPSDRFILAVLGASASYIAVPAAMKMAVPQANPGLYLPMALAVTFPINITLGLPLFYSLISGVVV